MQCFIIVSRESTDKDVTIAILWALASLPERKICKLIMQNESLLELILDVFRRAKCSYLRLPALRFVGNICVDDDILVKKLLMKHEILDTLQETITDSKSLFIRKETCWIISNIT